MARHAVSCVAALLAASSCGGSPPPPATQVAASKAPPATAATAEPSAEAPAKQPLPTTCTSDAAGLCTPPTEFVKRLCGGFYPDVALILFAKDSPWTRGYLSRNVEG